MLTATDTPPADHPETGMPTGGTLVVARPTTGVGAGIGTLAGVLRGSAC